MDTLLCYFYSTMPQVLFGAIGLLGVFCLFKLDLIRKTLVGLTKSMAYELKTNKAYNKLKKYNKYKKEFNKHIRRIKIAAIQSNPRKMKTALDETYAFVKQFYPNTNMNEQIIEPFEDQMKIRKKLINSTIIALICTGFLILFSFFAIPYIKSVLTICPYLGITKYNCLALILLIIMIALFLFNLIIIINIVLRSLDTDK